MLKTVILLLCSSILFSCGTKKTAANLQSPNDSLVGTWQLIKGTLIDKGDTVVTDYTQQVSFIKIINASHFAFLQHAVNKAKDSTNFVAGGGRYSLHDSIYTEHLEYCSDPQWEGNDFPFTITIKNDTLTQRGIEKVAGTAINRVNIETYKRVTP